MRARERVREIHFLEAAMVGSMYPVYSQVPLYVFLFNSGTSPMRTLLGQIF